MSEVNVSEARDGFADLLNRVTYGGERVVIRRRGKAVGALISAEDLALLAELEDRADAEAARAALREAEREGTVSWDALKSETEP